MKIMNILHLMLLLPLPLPLGSSNKSNGKLCDKFVILSKHDKKIKIQLHLRFKLKPLEHN